MKQLSLSELQLEIKNSLENAFPEPVWVIAEIAEFNVYRTGHCYLDLIEKSGKSDKIKAKARATIWAFPFKIIQHNFERKTGRELQKGLKILAQVKPEMHELYGFSLNITDIDPNYTLGELASQRQETINKLMEFGIFEMNKSLEISKIPKRIALISSESAAGYDDFMHQITQNSKNYKFEVQLFPSLMQGNEAAAAIIRALEAIYAQESNFDVVVMVRGGGAKTDMAAFDEFELAANIAQFPLPVLTGIGHNRDESVADLVANRSLKTPTAVAEFLIAKFDETANELLILQNRLAIYTDLFFNENKLTLATYSQQLKPIVLRALERRNEKLQHAENRFQKSIKTVSENERKRLANFAKMMQLLTPRLLKMKKMQLQQKTEKLEAGLTSYFKLKNEKLGNLTQRTNASSPYNILKRGYSITKHKGKAITDVALLEKGAIIETVLFNGIVFSEITETAENGIS